MALKNIKFKRSKRRAMRTRNRMRGKNSFARVSVFRSLKQISVQLIDDAKHVTVASASSMDIIKERTGDKTAQAKAVGLILAGKAKKNKIEKVYFDRGPYRYHGRIKALVDGLREGGLIV